LLSKNGKPIVIDGLWALLPGTATNGGEGTLWFSAGPAGETRGLVGQILPARKDAHDRTAVLHACDFNCLANASACGVDLDRSAMDRGARLRVVS
jgi:hypothetical protein